MRILGVDFGFKRIGLAIAESEFALVTPRSPIQASGVLKRDAESVAAIARAEQVDLIVVGLPLDEDGSLGKMARICERVADNLQGLGFNVRKMDESYTSVEADAMLRNEGLKASERRKLRDGESAGILLERYLVSVEES